MTTFTCNSGTDEYFDAKSGGSTNATLDSYVISNRTRLIIRTDSNACSNHSVAFGSLDNVSYSGTGGTLHFDPTYVRFVAYTGGSGNPPAFGTTISQGGVSGVFLGAWTDWQSEPIVPGAAINATGFIKIGGVTGGTFGAGALTGITATCSGADLQCWMEVRGQSTATTTVGRVGAVTSVKTWFELGTTNGSRGQVISCPTTATNAGVFPGVWIETSAGSGIYEKYVGVGSMPADAATATDDRCKYIWSTTSGIRIGSDGTNNAGFLPPTGCKVRIPAIILTNSTRSAGLGSGPRVLPNATLSSRMEFVTDTAGYIDLQGVVCQWYANFSQPYYLKIDGCAFNDKLIVSEVASALDGGDVIVSPTQAQVNPAFQVTACYGGGTFGDVRAARYSVSLSTNAAAAITYTVDTDFPNVYFEILTLRTAAARALDLTGSSNCTFATPIFQGGKCYGTSTLNCTITNPTYYDHNLTTTTTSTNPQTAVLFDEGCDGNVVDGWLMPLPNFGPYDALAGSFAASDVFFKNVGTSYSSPLAMNSSVTGRAFYSVGRTNGIRLKRIFVSGTRVNPWTLANSDNNVTVENVRGDYADTTPCVPLNSVFKNCGVTGTTTGQTSVYGTHWMTKFTSSTTGGVDLFCNEPTTASAAQCAVTGGAPQFDSVGSLLLTKTGDQVTWEMPFFAIGYTAFTASAVTVTGTNVTFTSGSSWGNHTLEYQINLNDGNGYNGSWLALNDTNLVTHTISATLGFKLQIRATTLTVDATNTIRRISIPLTTTLAAQDAGLYALVTATLTISGIVSGSDVLIFNTGTETLLTSSQDTAGTTFSYLYGTFVAVDIAVYKVGYLPYYITNYTLTTSDATLLVSQDVDGTAAP